MYTSLYAEHLSAGIEEGHWIVWIFIIYLNK